MSLNDGAGCTAIFSCSRWLTACGHVDFELDVEVGRGGLRLGHAAGDGLLRAGQRAGERLAAGGGGAGGRRLHSAAGRAGACQAASCLDCIGIAPGTMPGSRAGDDSWLLHRLLASESAARRPESRRSFPARTARAGQRLAAAASRRRRTGAGGCIAGELAGLGSPSRAFGRAGSSGAAATGGCGRGDRLVLSPGSARAGSASAGLQRVCAASRAQRLGCKRLGHDRFRRAAARAPESAPRVRPARRSRRWRRPRRLPSRCGRRGRCRPRSSDRRRACSRAGGRSARPSRGPHRQGAPARRPAAPAAEAAATIGVLARRAGPTPARGLLAAGGQAAGNRRRRLGAGGLAAGASAARAIWVPIGTRLTLSGEDLDQHAGDVGLVGDRRLVGLDLDELLAARDLVARPPSASAGPSPPPSSRRGAASRCSAHGTLSHR